MKLTSFTIVAVCSNTKEIFFRDFLESVVAQDYDNWELYIIDDDNSPDIEKITREFFPEDTRVHYRRLKKRTGKAYGTNIGFHFAEGDYVLITDCHNRLDKSCLYMMADYILDMGNVDVLYSDHIDIEGIEKTKIHVKQSFNRELFLRNNYIGDTVLINRDVIKKMGQVREVLTEAYLYEYLLRCMEKKYVFSHIPKFLYYKRIMYADMYKETYSGVEGVVNAESGAAPNSGVGAASTTPTGGGGIVGIIRSVFPNFMKNPVTGEDIDKKELIYKESMAAVKAYLKRNHIEAELKSEPAKRFWKIEYDGSGANLRKKDYMLLKSDNVKVSGRHYLEKMFGYMKRKDVAVVGVRFAKPFWTTENSGYIYDSEGNIYPAFYNVKLRDGGYDNLNIIPREIGMVDGDFCMISTKAYKALGGFDKTLAGRDVMLDFCIRARKRGYRVIIDPTITAKKYSSEAISSEGSHNRLVEKLGDELKKGDPFYSPNLQMGLINHTFMESGNSNEPAQSTSPVQGTQAVPNNAPVQGTQTVQSRTPIQNREVNTSDQSRIQENVTRQISDQRA